jgi:hypothetical protein
MEDPFRALEVEDVGVAVTPVPVSTPAATSVVTGHLHGFDLDETPLVSGLPTAPGRVLPARTTVDLRQKMIGDAVVVVFEQGDPLRPIVIGVIQDPAVRPKASIVPLDKTVSVHADDQRVVIRAEREIELQCGAASITLTRAGKVLIKGTYVLSRSSGYNKIKGAAVDIN